jgi:acetoin utilization deacetylase AcuC-like enzyme
MDVLLSAYYCDRFVLPLPAGHRFPMEKYARLREQAQKRQGVRLCEPEPASRQHLLLAHDAEYIDRVFEGRLQEAETREIGFPWSIEMVERSVRSVGATIAAARDASLDGVAVNLAGGTHHAFRNRGSGFCVFNDVAVAARVLQQERIAFNVLIVDLDVHQGNGTASIFASDASVFTLSLHAEKNFPARKETSDLDVGLVDGVTDEPYLEALADGLERSVRAFSPDFIFYVAGADAHEGDRLGRLKLTLAGMARRDAMVFDFARSMQVPIAVTMAGGYGKVMEDTVAVHAGTVDAALSARRMLTGQHHDAVQLNLASAS